MIEFIDNSEQAAVIKVIGIGGAGGNAVERMLKAQLDGVGFISANTDVQDLKSSSAPTVLQIGERLTKGLGAGADPDIGRQAAIEDRDRIGEALKGTDMLFVTAGMGGGTGTGAAPVVAEIAREMGMLTVAVVTRPFPFEGNRRMRNADSGLAALKGQVDSLITIPNEKVMEVMGEEADLLDSFNKPNEVLLGAVQGISELITRPGLINVDFADVRSVMSEMGMAMMGSAAASGKDRAKEAARMAISSPLLEDVDLNGAKGMLVNITAAEMTIGEYQAVGNTIHQYAADDANVVIGTALDPSMQGELRVTMVATGLLTPGDAPAAAAAARSAPPSPPASAHTPLPRMQRPPPPATPSPGGRRAPMVNGSGGKMNIDDLELPAFLRRQAE